MKNKTAIEGGLEAAISPGGELVLIQQRNIVTLNLEELEAVEKYISHFRHMIMPAWQQ